MPLLELAMISGAVFGTSLIIWNAATFFYTIPHKDISGFEMARRAAYRHLDLKRAIVGVLTVITFVAAPTDHRSTEIPGLLIVSMLLYFVYGTMCYFDSVKAARSYLAKTRAAGSVITNG
jgi:hypothetical protein